MLDFPGHLQKKKIPKSTQESALVSCSGQPLALYFCTLIYTRVSGRCVCPVCLETEFRTLCVLGNCSTTELQTPALRDMLDHHVPQLLYEKANYEEKFILSNPLLSGQWFSTFLMLQPFFLQSLTLWWPLTIKLFLLLLHKCSFAVIMNRNVFACERVIWAHRPPGLWPTCGELLPWCFNSPSLGSQGISFYSESSLSYQIAFRFII